MAGLVLKLAPNERILINGVVMENGERKATLKIKTPNAAILRLRDALHPDDVSTPVTRAYYTAQLVVAGSKESEDAQMELVPLLDALGHAFAPIKEAEIISTARTKLEEGNYYGVMRALHPLIAVEKALLAGLAAQGHDAVPASAEAV